MIKRLKSLILCAAIVMSAVCSTSVANAIESTPQQATVKSVVDESAVSSVEKESDNPQTAGEMINNISNSDTYEEALRTVLDDYYLSSDEESIEELTDTVDKRADEIIENYEQASVERNTDEEDLGYMSGEVLVVTKPNITDEDIPSLIADNRMGIVSVNNYSENRKLVKLNISLEYTVNSAIEKLKSNKYIDFIQKDYLYSTEDIFAEELSNDYYINQLFYLNAIKSPDAWNYIESVKHEKIKVGIIDTGAQLDHPDLKNVINKDMSVRITSDGIIAPLNGDNGMHGSHVSGIVAGEANNSLGVAGVASSVNNDVVELVEIGSDTGTGSNLSSLVIYKAILYAIDNNIRVVNMSLGGMTDPDNIFQSAIDLANKSGCVVVCAAGNENSSDYHYPSDCDGAISVIALNESCTARANYSNYGGKKNKVSAPGTNIISCVPESQPAYNFPKGYESFSGTSMATPVVTAIAGMMLSVNPHLTASSIKNIIYSTCTDMGKNGYDIEYGYGIVNAYKAVKKAAETDTSNVPTSVKFSTSRVSINKGDSYKLSSKVICDGDFNDVYYHSEDDGIAKVDQYGRVTAISTGETEIVVSTENGITAKCLVAVISKNNSQLSSPTATTIQTGVYTGARITWNSVDKADYYQIYATCDKNDDFRYIGSTSSTSYSANMGLIGDEIPASNVTKYKIKAISNSSLINDSELSNEFVYVYVGQEPYLNVDQILDKEFDTGLLVHWSAIACSKLYRHSEYDKNDVLLAEFGEDHTLNYYNDTDLIDGVTYTYTLKLFTKYNGVEYSEISDTLTIKYLDDDPIDTKLGKSEINSVSFDQNKFYTEFRVFDTCHIYQILASENNGRSWFDINNSVDFTPGLTNSECDDLDYGKTYLVKCKGFKNELFGTYRDRSEYSDTIRVKLPTKLATPEINIERTSLESALITWKGVPNASYYTLYRRMAGSSTWQIYQPRLYGCSYKDNFIFDNNIYYYKITATDNETDFSAENISGGSITVNAGSQTSDDSNVAILNTVSDKRYMSLAKVSNIENQTYSGSPIMPEISVTYNGETLEQDNDYTIEYSSNTNVGTALVKLTGKNKYTGSRTISFKITDNTDYKYHTVTYKDYDGKIIDTQTVKDGEKTQTIQPPYREGFSFVGWDRILDNIFEDITVTAKYSEEDKMCNVAFLDKNGNVIETQKVEYGNDAKAPNIPEYSGYKFKGWSNEIFNVTESISVRAIYEATQFESGNGTATSPYVISNKEQLNLFSKLANSSDEYASAYYILKNDIIYNDMADFEHWGNDNRTNEQNKPDNVWTPVGSEARPFKGNFNGNAHSILGIYIFDMNSYSGFFGYAENADIYSLGIDQMYVKTEKYYAGGIVGKYVNSSNESHKIYSCYVKDSTIIASSICGGIVGELENTEKNSETKITDCYSVGCYVYSLWESVAGGLAGKVTSSGGTLLIKYCYTFNYVFIHGSVGMNVGHFIGTFTPNTENNAYCEINTCYYVMYGFNTNPIGNYEYFTENNNGHYKFINFNSLEENEADNSNNYVFNRFISPSLLDTYPDRVWTMSDDKAPRLYYEKDWYSLAYYLDNNLLYQQYYHAGEQIELPDRYFGNDYLGTDWSFSDDNTYSIMPDKNLNAYSSSYMVGNINGDETVSIMDATNIQKYLTDWIVLDETQIKAADVNADGQVNIIDVSLIQKYCAGTINIFTASDMPQKQTLPTVVTEPQTTVSPTTEPITTLPIPTQPTTEQIESIAISVEDDTAQKWLSNDNAVIILVDNNTNVSYEMQKTDNIWTTTVPKSVNNITIKRMNPTKDTVWNSWNTTILGTKFKIINDSSGNWA